MSAVWDGSVAPGGYVCGVCGIPVESEPCAAHEDAPTLRECAECHREEVDDCDEPVHEDYPLCWVHAGSHCWSCSLATRYDEQERGLRGNW